MMRILRKLFDQKQISGMNYKNTFIFLLITFLTLFNTMYCATITSVKDGNWYEATTWGGVVPGATDDVIINHTVSIINLNNRAKNITVNSGKTLSFASTNAYLIISPSGSITNNGTISMVDPNVVVELEGSATITGNITFGQFIISGPGNVDLGTGTTIGKNLQINHTGVTLINHSPSYDPAVGGVLFYNVNGSYTAGLEWAPVSSGAGIPNYVSISEGTTLTLSGSSAHYAPHVEISSTAELQLSTSTGGDLYLTGSGFIDGGLFTPNGRKVVLCGSEQQVIESYTDLTTFDDLEINNPAGVLLDYGNIKVNKSLNISSGSINTTADNYKITMSGTEPQTISGSNPVIDNLEINNSTGVTILTNIQVDKSLVFTSGKLYTTADHKVIIGSSASVTESINNNIDGYVESTKEVGTGSITDWAGLGVSVSAGIDDVGTVKLTRVTGTNAIQTYNGKSGIACAWAFEVPAGVPNGRSVSLSWFSNYDNSRTLSSMRVWATLNGGVSWFDLSGTDQNASARVLNASYLYPSAGTAVFTVSDNSNPLPVELTSFTANVKEEKVLLNWSTATEVNNYGFEVERSLVTGHQSFVKWEKIGFVAGSGNSNSPKEYSFTDDLIKTSEVFKNLRGLATGNIQYRLKQIDTDGGFEYYAQTAEVNISLTDVKEKQMPKEFSLEQNYPNPFNPSTVISYQLPVNGHVELKVYNLLGKEVAVLANEDKSAGYYQVKFDGSNLSSGMYIYKLTAGSFTSTKKLVLMK